MSRYKPVLRFGAIASSLVLAGGFIAYRAGALDDIFMSSSKSSLIGLGEAYQELANRSAAEADLPTERYQPVMSGTKSFGPNVLIPTLNPKSTPNSRPGESEPN